MGLIVNCDIRHRQQEIRCYCWIGTPEQALSGYLSDTAELNSTQKGDYDPSVAFGHQGGRRGVSGETGPGKTGRFSYF